MFRIVSVIYSRLLCEAIRAVCSGSCQSYTADYCVKPLGLYVQDRVIYSRLLCEAIRAVCSGSCQSYTADYCVKPLGLYVQDRVSQIQPTIV